MIIDIDRALDHSFVLTDSPWQYGLFCKRMQAAGFKTVPREYSALAPKCLIQHADIREGQRAFSATFFHIVSTANALGWDYVVVFNYDALPMADCRNELARFFNDNPAPDDAVCIALGNASWIKNNGSHVRGTCGRYVLPSGLCGSPAVLFHKSGYRDWLSGYLSVPSSALCCVDAYERIHPQCYATDWSFFIPVHHTSRSWTKDRQYFKDFPGLEEEADTASSGDDPRISLLSFGTTTWPKARARFLYDIKWHTDRHTVFKRASLLSERDLGSDYFDRFRPFLDDYGYAYGTWKPYCILRELSQLNDGELLLYLDVMYGLPRRESDSFVRDLAGVIADFTRSGCVLGLTRYTLGGRDYPNGLITKKDILRKFYLEGCFEFCDKYPHYQSGLILLQKRPDTVECIQQWYDFMYKNYEGCITGPFTGCQGECAGFNHNGADQAVLQCLLYSQSMPVFDMSGLMERYSVARRRPQA